MKKYTILVLAAFGLWACEGSLDKETEQEPLQIRIDPVITKAGDTDFEVGDRIGITVNEDGELYKGNALLTLSEDLTFSGDLYWYLEPQAKAELLAYYPYVEGETLPTSFSVKENQSSGFTASDFLTAYKKNVSRSGNAISMVFRHRMTKVLITVANTTGEKISSIKLLGTRTKAGVDVATGKVEVDTLSEAAPITAFNTVPDTSWVAIVVPQKVSIGFSVTLASGKVLTQKMADMSFQSGTSYKISAVVYNDNIKIVTSAAIQDWVDGGDIPSGDYTGGGDTPGTEPTDSNVLVYGGVSYKTVLLKDGKRWMAENLRYIPDGKFPTTDTSDYWNGIYYPIDKGKFHTDEDYIKKNGYLYTADLYLGKSYSEIKDSSDVKALEGCRGICPEGWHIPTMDDWRNLVGKGSDYVTLTTAPYYDANDCSLTLLNKDNFNLGGTGYLYFNYKSSYKYCCTVATNNNCFLGGSSFARITFFSGTEEGPDVLKKGDVKQVMVRGLMVMGNACKGVNTNWNMACPVRCVKN